MNVHNVAEYIEGFYDEKRDINLISMINRDDTILELIAQ